MTGDNMVLDVNKCYSLFENVKAQKEYKDYVNEIAEIDKSLNKIPFDNNEANRQINKLINKYTAEFNVIAVIFDNKMSTTYVNYPKTENQTKNELSYIKSCIPIIALIKEKTSHELNSMIDKIVQGY